MVFCPFPDDDKAQLCGSGCPALSSGSGQTEMTLWLPGPSPCGVSMQQRLFLLVTTCRNYCKNDHIGLRSTKLKWESNNLEDRFSSCCFPGRAPSDKRGGNKNTQKNPKTNQTKISILSRCLSPQSPQKSEGCMFV